MSNHEHAQFEEWLDLEHEAGLSSEEQAQLALHLDSCEDCRRGRRELAALRGLLAGRRIEVRPQFASQVMSALPPAPWAPRRSQPWGLAIGLVAALAAVSSVLLAWGEQASSPQTSLWTAVTALGDFLSTSLVAGGGLMAMSWRGIGMAVGSWLLVSVPNLIFSSFVVIGSNILLFRLLRQGARLDAVGTRRRSSPRRSS